MKGPVFVHFGSKHNIGVAKKRPVKLIKTSPDGYKLELILLDLLVNVFRTVFVAIGDIVPVPTCVNDCELVLPIQGINS